MITHFQWQPLYADKNLPGWRISFYYKKKLFQAIYHKNGNIEWIDFHPPKEDESELNSMIHELMLYHVYE
ncbi:YheE family protein [Peribacillus sp. SCS-155]|uniref:YheE family protein n=1 Tax=Peribacillus sedimenti TaxID=3115297 RepID=UPI0039069F83